MANPLSLQYCLPLFTNPSFDEIIDLEKLSGLKVKASFRLKRSWHLKISHSTGDRLLTVPAYLDSAPALIKSSLIKWALLPVHSRKPDIKQLKLMLEKDIQAYILSLDPALYSNRLDIAKLQLNTKGYRYDLKEVFDNINKSYFNNSIVSSVRWGSKCSLTSYQTTRTTKNGTRFNLITIAGVYNHPDVPLFALEAVMYHEMLHIEVPPYKKNGRSVIHSPEFKNRERQFAFYDQWHEWEKKCIRNLAINLRKKTRSEKKFKLFNTLQ